VDPKRIVREGYDRIAERYAAWAAGGRADERARYAAVLLDGLPEGAAVLELGCGAGGPTTRALAARFTLTGVDLSERSVALARENIPRATFVRGDMTALDFPPAGFDGVAAFFSIIHVPREEQSGLLGKVAKWLRPGGLFVASFGVSGTAAGHEDDWLGAPMYRKPSHKIESYVDGRGLFRQNHSREGEQYLDRLPTGPLAHNSAKERTIEGPGCLFCSKIRE